MKIHIAAHTLERAQERGTNEDEIRDVLVNGFHIPARKPRTAKAKIYPFQKERLNKYYEEKRVEVIYIIENDTIITVTVYVFYGSWKERK